MSEQGAETGLPPSIFSRRAPVLLTVNAFVDAVRAVLGAEIADRLSSLLAFLRPGGEPMNWGEAAVALLASAYPGTNVAPGSLNLREVRLVTDADCRITLALEEIVSHPLLERWVRSDLSSQFSLGIGNGGLLGAVALGAPAAEELELFTVEGWLGAILRLTFPANAPGSTVTAELHFGPAHEEPRPEPEADPTRIAWPSGALANIGRLARDFSDPVAPGQLTETIVANTVQRERAGAPLH